MLSRSLRWKTRSIATAASTRLGPLEQRDQRRDDQPDAPGDRERQPVRARAARGPRAFSTAIATATTASAAAQHQTSADRNR